MFNFDYMIFKQRSSVYRISDYIVVGKEWQREEGGGGKHNFICEIQREGNIIIVM